MNPGFTVFLLLAHVGTSSGDDAQKRSDDTLVRELENTVNGLASQVTSLTAQLTALKNQVTSQQTKLDTVSKTVAFYTLASADITATPGGPIVINKVHTNVGSGYDPQTGFFTAPVSGVYQFAAAYMAIPGNEPNYVHAEIVVNGRLAAVSISDSRHSYYDHTSLHAIEHVLAGQKVYLRNVDQRVASYFGGSYLTFSGFLLRAD